MLAAGAVIGILVGFTAVGSGNLLLPVLLRCKTSITFGVR